MFGDGRDPELIFLTDGASKGVMQMLNALIRNENDGVRKLVAICSYVSFGWNPYEIYIQICYMEAKHAWSYNYNFNHIIGLNFVDKFVPYLFNVSKHMNLLLCLAYNYWKYCVYIHIKDGNHFWQKFCLLTKTGIFIICLCINDE